MKMAATLSIGLALAGCVSDPHYAKPGASDEDYQRQLARCRVVAAQTPAGDGLMGAGIVGATLQNCMRAEGWVRDN